MAWLIRIDDAARKELEQLDRPISRRITSFLRQRVSMLDNPRSIGEPLKSSQGELWRYRVGDYRIVCEIHDSEICILVVRVAKRDKVYNK